MNNDGHAPDVSSSDGDLINATFYLLMYFSFRKISDLTYHLFSFYSTSQLVQIVSSLLMSEAI